LQAYLNVLRKVPLFDGLETGNILPALSCLNGEKKEYRKNDILLAMGEKVTHAGIVLAGTVEVTLYDATGTRVMINQLRAGGTFAEAPACSGTTRSLMQITTVTDCRILLLNVSQLFSPNRYVCPHRLKVMENLLKLLADENLFYNRKIQLLTQRTIRGKLRLYFLALARDCQADEFTIPFSRNELADYLFVDRSALSRELGRMRDQQLIRFERNWVKLLTKDL
jgi:CRP-like cAMP-binding protein